MNDYVFDTFFCLAFQWDELRFTYASKKFLQNVAANLVMSS